MSISIGNAIAAYNNASKSSAISPAAGSDGAKGSGTGFADLLRNAAESAIETERKGEATSLQAATGKADINNVVTAVTNAEVTLQTVVAVRDKVVSAYQEILHMSI